MNGIKNYKQIIIDLQKEDEKVFAEFLSSHFVLVYHYVKNYINDVRLSLDLTMEVFLKLYYKVLDYEYSSDFDFITWMFNVAKFTVEDKLKDEFSLKAKHAKIMNSLDNFDELYNCHFCRKMEVLTNIDDLLEVIIANFNGVAQFIMISKIYNDVDFVAIAEILNLDENKVRYIYNKSMEQLLKVLNIDSSEKVS